MSAEALRVCLLVHLFANTYVVLPLGYIKRTITDVFARNLRFYSYGICIHIFSFAVGFV